MSKPSILFINRVYPPVRGATGRLLKDLAESFVNDGWNVTIITTGSKADDKLINDVRVIRIKANERPSRAVSYMWIWVKMLFMAMRINSHNVLVTLSDPPMIIIVGRIISKIKKSNHINWCQDLYPDIVPALGIKMPKLLIKYFRVQRIKAMKACDKIIVCGRCMAKHLARDGIELNKIKMVANWADFELSHPNAKDKGVNNSNNINKKMIRPFEKQVKNKQRFRVLYAGNIGLAHPIDIVLDAAKILETQDSDIEFVFVGSGKRFDYIAQKRSELCLNNITLLPYQPASYLREIMESGDIHLVTMSDEAAGFMVPCKVYTAMAVARPCIFVGPLESEIAKIINEFESGLIISHDDTENLVKSILNFRQNGDAWFDAHRGAMLAREKYSSEESIKSWIAHAQSLIN